MKPDGRRSYDESRNPSTIQLKNENVQNGTSSGIDSATTTSVNQVRKSNVKNEKIIKEVKFRSGMLRRPKRALKRNSVPNSAHVYRPATTQRRRVSTSVRSRKPAIGDSREIHGKVFIKTKQRMSELVNPNPGF